MKAFNRRFAQICYYSVLSLAIASCGTFGKKSKNKSTPPAPQVSPSPSPVVQPGPQQVIPTPLAAVLTEILGTEGIVNGEVTQPSIKFTFRTQSVGARFDCKHDTETSFSKCPGDNSYEFVGLKDGEQHSLTVHAVNDQARLVGKDETISFKVNLSKVTILNADGLEQTPATGGTRQLRFQYPGATSFMCTLNQQQPQDCANGLPLNISQLPTGSYHLQVEARNQGGQVIGTNVLNFCAQRCSDSATGGTNPIQPQNFLVGNFYSVQVPPQMHVTEYATNKNVNNQLTYYRISTSSDPFYTGNYTCNSMFDALRQLPGPNGSTMTYCVSTPPVLPNTRNPARDDMFKWMTSYRIAYNSIEMATNPEIVQQNPAAQQRISMNVFDRDFEFMAPRSRFDKLCANAYGGVRRSPPIAFAQGFWEQSLVVANFFSCTINLSGGFGGGQEVWQVVGIFSADRAVTPGMQDWGAFSRQDFRNQRMVEIVYMERANERNATPDLLIQSAQQTLLPLLKQAQR